MVTSRPQTSLLRQAVPVHTAIQFLHSVMLNPHLQGCLVKPSEPSLSNGSFCAGGLSVSVFVRHTGKALNECFMQVCKGSQ